ncbi:helix-turn-helix domain-containing protein [Mitsuokella multacida]
MISFGRRLAVLRELRGYSRLDLAIQIGVDRRTIYNWEHNRTIPKNYDGLLQLCKALQVPITFWKDPDLTENELKHC